MNKQKGFTLIELVIVIVILGILSATALPKFLDLSDDATQAAVAGVAGGLSAANGINVAGCAISPTDDTRCTAMAVTEKCSKLGTLLSPPLTLTVLPTTAADVTKGTYYLTADTTLGTSGISCELYLDGKKASFSATSNVLIALP